MKTKNIIAYSIAVVLCALTSCEHTNTLNPTETAVEPQLTLIKLSQDMLNKVFVSPIVDSVLIDHTQGNLYTLYYGEGLVLCNPTKQDSVLADFAAARLNILGISPYVQLDNGYVLVHWKWTRFHPLSGAFRKTRCNNSYYSTNAYYMNGRIANEGYYVLPINWDEITILRTIWPNKEGIAIDKPELRYVNIADIEKYGAYQESSKRYFEENDLYRMYNLYVKDSGIFETQIQKMDVLQQSYVETLNQMIKNRDFEKWTQRR